MVGAHSFKTSKNRVWGGIGGLMLCVMGIKPEELGKCTSVEGRPFDDRAVGNLNVSLHKDHSWSPHHPRIMGK